MFLAFAVFSALIVTSEVTNVCDQCAQDLHNMNMCRCLTEECYDAEPPASCNFFQCSGESLIALCAEKESEELAVGRPSIAGRIKCDCHLEADGTIKVAGEYTRRTSGMQWCTGFTKNHSGNVWITIRQQGKVQCMTCDRCVTSRKYICRDTLNGVNTVNRDATQSECSASSAETETETALAKENQRLQAANRVLLKAVKEMTMN